MSSLDRIRHRAVLAASLALLLACSSAKPLPAGAGRSGPEDLRAGMLGHPLGSYLSIGGVRDTSGKTGDATLRVDTVNGAPLVPPVSLWVEDITLPKGERVELKGYESGRFIGLPDEVSRATGHPTQACWQFQKYFVATSIESGGARRLREIDSR